MTEKETGVGNRVYLSGEPNPADFELYINKKPETWVLLGKILDGSATSEDRARLEMLSATKARALKRLSAHLPRLARAPDPFKR